MLVVQYKSIEARERVFGETGKHEARSRGKRDAVPEVGRSACGKTEEATVDQ